MTDSKPHKVNIKVKISSETKTNRPEDKIIQEAVEIIMVIAAIITRTEEDLSRDTGPTKGQTPDRDLTARTDLI